MYNLSGGYKTWEYVTQKQSNEDIFAKDVIGKDDKIYQADVDKEASVMRDEPSTWTQAGSSARDRSSRLKQEIDKILPGERIKETATDPGFKRDVDAWCSMTGHLSRQPRGDRREDHRGSGENGRALQARGSGYAEERHHRRVQRRLRPRARRLRHRQRRRSAGKKVTMFFTFWGLNVLKKNRKPKVKKDFMGKMFGMMLPGNTEGLKLSKLNMAGMGPVMMRKRMASLKIDSLEDMIGSAVKGGVGSSPARCPWT